MTPLLSRLLRAGRVLVLAGFLAPLASAQTAPASAAAPQGIQFRAFIAAQSGIAAPDLALFDPNRQAVPVETLNGNVSLPQAAPPGEKLLLYSRPELEKALAARVASGDKNGPLPAPLAELAFAAGVKRYLLILQPDRDEWSYSLLADTPAAFPAGSVLFFNATPYPFQAALGPASLNVSSRGHAILAPQPDPADFHVDALLRTQQGGEWKPCLQQRWVINPRLRFIAIPWEYAKGDIRVALVGDAGPQP